MMTSVFSTFLELLLKADEDVLDRLGRVGGADDDDGGMATFSSWYGKLRALSLERKGY